MSAREERLAAADRLTDVLARVVGTASHPSGMVTVTASAVGALKSVRIHPAALGRGPDAVGRLVVETARLATDAAVQTGYNELAKALGDGMAMAVEGFAGPPPFRRARTDAPGPHDQSPGAGQAQHAPGGYGQPQGSWGAPPTDRYAPGGPGAAPHPQGAAGTAYPQGAPGAGGPGPGRPEPPWAGPQSGRLRPRPVPPPVEDDDEDDFFADPFRGQRR